MQCETIGCCDDKYGGRQFLTKEEKIEKLQEYKEWLDSESKGVEEAISKLRSRLNFMEAAENKFSVPIKIFGGENMTGGEGCGC